MKIISTWIKRGTAALVSLSLLFVMTPAVMAADLMNYSAFYLKQSKAKTCTLASAAMMLRRLAYLDGDENWMDVDESDVKSAAWFDGLSHSFRYQGMKVRHDGLPSGAEAKEQRLIELLEKHPEGIVLYDRTTPHAILLTDYTDGAFYCSDPAKNCRLGRIPVEESNISIRNASSIWYVADDWNDAALMEAPSGLRLEGMFYPENVRRATSFALGGAVHSAEGEVINSVEINLLDLSGSVVQTVSATPRTGEYSFDELDELPDAIRFAQLPEGSYTFNVVVKESSGRSICFAAEFGVSDEDTSRLYYWSERDPGGSMLLDSENGLNKLAENLFSWKTYLSIR